MSYTKNIRSDMMKFQKEMTLGEIVSTFPGSEKILKKYDIDYCCGGHRVVREVTSEQNIDVNDLLSKLEAAYEVVMKYGEEKVDWVHAPIDHLVEHILQAHHAFLHSNLGYISELTTKILRVHGEHHPELLEVFQTFHQLKMELEAHLIKEETVQYPAIKKYIETNNLGDLNKAVKVIDELENEHTFAGDCLKQLRKISGNYEVPADGCSTFLKTYEMLELLESNTFTHIHLENNILFGRLKELKQ